MNQLKIIGFKKTLKKRRIHTQRLIERERVRGQEGENKLKGNNEQKAQTSFN